MLSTSDDGGPENAEEARLITDVLIAYTVFYDAGDIDQVLSLFAPDATYSSFLGTFSGTTELRTNFAPLVARYRRSAHLLSNVTISLRGPEAAHANSYVHAVMQPHDGPAYAFVGSYEDTLAKRDGRWRIVTRTVHDGLAYAVEPIEPAERLPDHGT